MTNHMPLRQSFTLFCESFRIEEGTGRFSVEGVWPAEIPITEQEQEERELVVMTLLDIPASSRPRPMKLSMFDREEMLLSSEFEIPPNDVDDVSDLRVVLTLPIEIPNFRARAGMELFVTATTKEFEYRSHSVKVVPAGVTRVGTKITPRSS